MIRVSNSFVNINPSEMVGTKEYKNDSFDVYWRGIVYIPGVIAGLPSVSEFVNRLLSKSIEDACVSLYGTFFMVIKDKKHNKAYSFIDNSGIFKAYFSNTVVSDSFLSLINDKSINDVSPETIVEFIQYGNIPFSRTFFGDIKKIKDKEIIVSDSCGTLSVLQKNISEISTPSNCEIMDFFRNACESFHNERLSVDMTGGIDTRLVAAMLSYFGTDFEMAISGIPEHDAITIAREVAKLFSRKLYVTYHEINTLEKDLDQIFIFCDGLADILTYHRLAQFHSDRAKRGATLGISGQGGELYRDYWWHQDFPFYNSPKISIDRLFKMHVNATPFPETILSETYLSLAKETVNKQIKLLRSYFLSTNTQTYDNIYYYFKEQEVPARLITNTNNYFLPFYPPLLELDLVRLGFNLKRRQRFFDMFHRKYITVSNLAAARMKTTNGTTVSSQKMDIFLDFCRRFIFKQIKKCWTKCCEQSPNNPEMISNVRHMQTTHRVVNSLKECGVLNRSLEVEAIPERYLGRIISVGLLLERIRST